MAEEQGIEQEQGVEQPKEPEGEPQALEQQPDPEKRYTDEDVNGIVAKRLSRERAKMEKEIRETIAKEQADGASEAEKLRGMNELQRAQYEARKLKAEKAALEGRIALSEMMDTARSELGEAGISLPDELLGQFVTQDAEKTKAAIDKVKELWPQAVNAAVQAALKRQPPEAEAKPSGKSVGAAFAESYTKKMNGGK